MTFDCNVDAPRSPSFAPAPCSAFRSQSGSVFASVSGCPAVIFRVQDPEGRGPWKPGFSHKWVEDRDDFDELVPWLQEFGPVHKNVTIAGMSVGCGCRTIEQLRRWFRPSEYKTLLGFGYRAVKLDVGRILAESKIQCVFERVKPLRENAEPCEFANRQSKIRSARRVVLHAVVRARRIYQHRDNPASHVGGSRQSWRVAQRTGPGRK